MWGCDREAGPSSARTTTGDRDRLVVSIALDLFARVEVWPEKTTGGCGVRLCNRFYVAVAFDDRCKTRASCHGEHVLFFSFFFFQSHLNARCYRRGTCSCGFARTDLEMIDNGQGKDSHCLLASVSSSAKWRWCYMGTVVYFLFFLQFFYDWLGKIGGRSSFFFWSWTF